MGHTMNLFFRTS